jgi:hypothetical protein
MAPSSIGSGYLAFTQKRGVRFSLGLLVDTYLTRGYYYVAVADERDGMPPYCFQCNTVFIFYFRSEEEFRRTMREARRQSFRVVTDD